MHIVSISAFKAPTPEKIWVAAQNLCVGKKSKFKQTLKQNLYRSFDLVDVIVERRLSLGVYLVFRIQFIKKAECSSYCFSVKVITQVEFSAYAEVNYVFIYLFRN